MVRFVVFHTGADTLKDYLPLMHISRAALDATNPGAEYVVLTDKETAPSLEKNFQVEVLAPSGWPLMRQYVEAQRAYEAKAEPGLVVLAATDCAPVRDFRDALGHNMAVTYRNSDSHMVNNIAYIEDHDRAAWFLQRALDCMDPAHYDVWGDQESWETALGSPNTWERLDESDYGVRVAKPEGRWIHLYPCRTHNYFPKKRGALSPYALKAYLWHFKGPRKAIMVNMVEAYILGGGRSKDWRDFQPQTDHVYPMQQRIERQRGK